MKTFGNNYIKKMIDSITNPVHDYIYMPAWTEDETGTNLGNIFKCKFNLSSKDCNKAKEEAVFHKELLFFFGEYYSRLSREDFGKMPVLTSKTHKANANQIKSMWNMYFKDFSYDAPENEIMENCSNRADREFMVCDRIISARRLCKLISTNAPFLSICKADKLFSQAYLFNAYGQSVEEIAFCSEVSEGSRIKKASEINSKDAEAILNMLEFEDNISYRKAAYFRFVSIILDDSMLGYKAIRTDFDQLEKTVDEALSTLNPFERNFISDYHGLKDGLRKKTPFARSMNLEIPSEYNMELWQHILMKLKNIINSDLIEKTIANT